MTENQIYMPIDLNLLYDHYCEPPADFLEECRLYWENIKRIHAEKQKATPTYYGIELDGTMYFYHGNTKIKVTEHFNDSGKPITVLVEDVVQYAAESQ